MLDLIRCKACGGKKRFLAMGGMYKDCKACAGVGWVEIERDAKQEKSEDLAASQQDQQEVKAEKTAIEVAHDDAASAEVAPAVVGEQRKKWGRKAKEK